MSATRSDGGSGSGGKLLTCTVITVIISIVIFATTLGLLVIWFESIPEDDQKASLIDEESVKFWVDCLRFPPGMDEFEYEICRAAGRMLPYIYEGTGRLNPEFREALSIVNNRNQTLVDIDICLLSDLRCSKETHVLLHRMLRDVTENDLCGDNIGLSYYFSTPCSTSKTPTFLY